MNVSPNNLKMQELSLEDIQSVLESALFAIGKPLSIKQCAQLFYKENISSAKIKKALLALTERYRQTACGLELVELAGAWQIRTKEENRDYIRRLIKGRMFQLSTPALEVLAIVVYKQPCVKAEIDEIRGVESGHLLRTLMEKDLVDFGPKSTAPGKPSTYKTTSRFLEVFGLKNLKSLPSVEDIVDLLPEELRKQTPDTNEELKVVINEFAGANNVLADEELLAKELKTVSEKIENVNVKIKEEPDLINGS